MTSNNVRARKNRKHISRRLKVKLLRKTAKMNPLLLTPFLLWLLKRRKKRLLRLERLRKRQQRRRRVVLEAILDSFDITFILLSRTNGLGLQERSIWTRPKSSVWWDMISKEEDDEKWQQNFRLSKKTFRFICDSLRERLVKKDTHLRKALDVERKVGMTLWRLATHSELRSVASLFGVGTSTVCSTVIQVCTAIVDILRPMFLRTPSEAEFQDVLQVFYEKFNIPQCAGILDRTHVSILCPKKYHAKYFNRNCFYSVTLQGVVDANYRFWNVSVGCPGSVTDSRVLSNSKLFKKAETNMLFPEIRREISGVDMSPYILGDGAYPLKTWLMKPFQHVGRLSREEVQYNYHVNRARCVIEDAFGRLKARWTCLTKRMDCDIPNVNTIVLACCILHNICENFHDPINEIDIQVAIANETRFDAPAAFETDDINAEGLRLALVNHFRGQSFSSN